MTGRADDGLALEGGDECAVSWPRRGFLRGVALAAASLGGVAAAVATPRDKRPLASTPGLAATPASASTLADDSASSGRCSRWTEWESFKRTYISPEGRVIDLGSERAHTVSEGQAYALFFALVASDRAMFDTLLRWTENNLASGDLTSCLPAWIWGRRDDGSWGALDPHSAADADLWLAYTLLEAGRRWDERRLGALGTLVARRILKEETARLPRLGQTVLPGPAGFVLGPQAWRLNPSYVPLQVMRRLAALLPDEARWRDMVDSSVKLIVDTAPHGFSPDWVEFEASSGFRTDARTQGESAYNAIRVYLWAGMLDDADPAKHRILERLRPMADYVAVHGYPPEKVSSSGQPGPNAGPPGFSAAVAPFLDALDQPALAQAQYARANTLSRQAEPSYYSQVLWLFALGWRDRRYAFADGGALRLMAGAACGAPVH